MNALIITSVITTALFTPLVEVNMHEVLPELPPTIPLLVEIQIVNTSFTAYVTGYNTVPEQTDSTPCIGSANIDICGRDDAVACPRSIPLHTKVIIRGKTYTCLDRLAPKYDKRFDISCDKDFNCPNRVTGYTEVTVIN